MRLLASCFFLEFASDAAANGGGLLTRPRISSAVDLGSFAAIMALTTATPSSCFVGHDD